MEQGNNPWVKTDSVVAGASDSPFVKTDEIVTEDKYKKIAPLVEQDPWADPMSLSEAGLDVGTPEQKKALTRNIAQGVTLGTSDEIEARLRSWIEGRPYEEVLEEIRAGMAEYKEAAPEAAMAQEFSGAVMSPASLIKAPKAVAEAGTLARSAFQVGAPSAVYGAASSEGDWEDRLKAGATAGAFGTFGGVVLDKTMKGLVGLADRNKVAPTVDTLKAMRDAAYKKVGTDKLFFNPTDTKTVLNAASEAAQRYNYVTVKGAPTAVERARKMIESVGKKNLTLGQVEQLRKNLYGLADSTTDKQTRAIVKDIARALDTHMDDIFAKSGDEGMKLARAAHSNYAKVKMLDDEFAKIEGSLAGKALSNRMPMYSKAAEKILNDPNKARWLSKQEVKLLDDFARGSVGDKTLNLLGKLSPESGLSTVLHVAAAATNPWIGLLTIGTAGAKLTSNKNTVKRAQKLIEQLGGVEAVKKMANGNVDPAKAWAIQNIEEILYGEE